MSEPFERGCDVWVSDDAHLAQGMVYSYSEEDGGTYEIMMINQQGYWAENIPARHVYGSPIHAARAWVESSRRACDLAEKRLNAAEAWLLKVEQEQGT